MRQGGYIDYDLSTLSPFIFVSDALDGQILINFDYFICTSLYHTALYPTQYLEVLGINHMGLEYIGWTLFLSHRTSLWARGCVRGSIAPSSARDYYSCIYISLQSLSDNRATSPPFRFVQQVMGPGTTLRMLISIVAPT